LRTLQALSDDERLEAEEAIASAISWDSKPGVGLVWVVAVFGLVIVSLNHVSLTLWICVLAFTALVGRSMQERSGSREDILCTVLGDAADKRLIPELLACRTRVATRWGSSSRRHLTIVAALERLFPLVTVEDVANLHPVTHAALIAFLTVPPRHPLVTLEVLRLAPVFGDSKVLDCINQLAAHPEWGGTVPADLCFQLHSAAVAAQSALRSAIEARRQASGLLRASEVPESEDESELLRSATYANLVPNTELLRPEQPAVGSAGQIDTELSSLESRS
jgi:hypothetical protein